MMRSHGSTPPSSLRSNWGSHFGPWAVAMACAYPNLEKLYMKRMSVTDYDLGILSTVSRAFYVFCSHEPLWRNLFLDSANDGFSYTESWKSTYVSVYKPEFDVGEVKGLVICKSANLL